MLPFDIINTICYYLSNVDVNNFLSTNIPMHKLKYKIKYTQLVTLTDHLITLPYYDSFVNLYVNKICHKLPKNIKYLILIDDYALKNLNYLNFSGILQNLTELKISSDIFDKIENFNFINKIKCINIYDGWFNVETICTMLKKVNTKLILDGIFLDLLDLESVPKIFIDFINYQQKINLSYVAHEDLALNIFQNKIDIFQNKINQLIILINEYQVVKETFDDFIIPKSVTVLKWSTCDITEDNNYIMEVVSTKLKIYYYFDNILEYINLFPTATHLKYNILDCTVPPQITHVTTEFFREKIHEYLPINLKYLKLGKYFDRFDELTIPKKLKILNIIDLNDADCETIYKIIRSRTDKSPEIKLLINKKHINEFKNLPANVVICPNNNTCEDYFNYTVRYKKNYYMNPFMIHVELF